jgi:hypothetical protein
MKLAEMLAEEEFRRDSRERDNEYQGRHPNSFSSQGYRQS